MPPVGSYYWCSQSHGKVTVLLLQCQEKLTSIASLSITIRVQTFGNWRWQATSLVFRVCMSKSSCVVKDGKVLCVSTDYTLHNILQDKKKLPHLSFLETLPQSQHSFIPCGLIGMERKLTWLSYCSSLVVFIMHLSIQDETHLLKQTGSNHHLHISIYSSIKFPKLCVHWV